VHYLHCWRTTASTVTSKVLPEMLLVVLVGIPERLSAWVSEHSQNQLDGDLNTIIKPALPRPSPPSQNKSFGGSRVVPRWTPSEQEEAIPSSCWDSSESGSCSDEFTVEVPLAASSTIRDGKCLHQCSSGLLTLRYSYLLALQWWCSWRSHSEIWLRRKAIWREW